MTYAFVQEFLGFHLIREATQENSMGNLQLSVLIKTFWIWQLNSIPYYEEPISLNVYGLYSLMSKILIERNFCTWHKNLL